MQRRTLLNLTLGALLILLAAKAALACFWDRDTLAQEAAGLPGVVEVLLGRIDRWPPEYYAMRLERVTKQLETEPNNLALYDDAAVASDRLKRFDNAIEWMARKRAVLDTLPANSAERTEHEYRYLANLGTHHAHRWIANGALGQDLIDLHRAIELIRAAIELNPDAHFGREKVQLGFLEALRYSRSAYGIRNAIPYGVFRSTDSERSANYEPEPWHAQYTPSPNGHWEDHPYALEIGETLRLADENRQVRFLGSQVRVTREEIIEGLTGLMVLGDAWQSIDVHEALIQGLYEGRGDRSVALLGACRVAELAANGSSSVLYPRRERHTPLLAVWVISSEVFLNHQIYEYFRTARPIVDRINIERLNFIAVRLNKGLHPDTDPNFWDGYTQEALPDLPNGVFGRTTPGAIYGFAGTWGGSVAAVLLISSIVLAVRITGRWKRLIMLAGGTAVAVILGAFTTLFLAGALMDNAGWPDDPWTTYDTFRAAMQSSQP